MANGDVLPPDPAGTPWKQHIDEFYNRNPQFLPNAPDTSGGPSQANFVSVFAVPEANMVKLDEKQAICSLCNQINVLIQEAVTVPEVEQPGIETTINVLNTRLQKCEEVAKAKQKAMKQVKADRP